MSDCDDSQVTNQAFGSPCSYCLKKGIVHFYMNDITFIYPERTDNVICKVRVITNKNIADSRVLHIRAPVNPVVDR
jgi:hypothetical protein